MLEFIVKPAIVLVVKYKSMEAREDFYPFIGKVVVRFQDADMFLNMFMMCLLGGDINVTQAFMVTLPFSKKLDIIHSVAPLKIAREDLLKRLDEVLKLLSKAEEERNKVVHATWMPSSKSNMIFFYKPKATRNAGLKLNEGRSMTIAEVEAIFKTIDNATNEFCDLAHTLEEEKIMHSLLFRKTT